MNDITKSIHFQLDEPIKKYPKGIWFNMRQIQATQRRIEEVISRNHGVLPSYSYQDPDIHTNYILETDVLIRQMDTMCPLIRELSGEELVSILSFIREGVLFYRMTSPMLLEGYVLFLENVLQERGDNQALSQEDREQIQIEVEYFRDIITHYT